jgi:penicillin amidase
MAAIPAARVSLPARELVEVLRTTPLAAGDSRPALDALLAWDGVMDRDGSAPTIYAAFRERLLRDLATPLLGPLAAEAFAGTPRGGVAHMARLKARLADMIRRDDRTLLPGGVGWPAALERALAGAVAELRERLGPDQKTWRWGRVHATGPQHPLAAVFPEAAALLNPPAIPMGGDGDTVQAAGYTPGAGFGLTLTSVARYVFDLGDWSRSAWVVPLGVSGHPGSPHYADQAAAWGECRLVPMRYDWSTIRAEAEAHQVLDPA